MNLQNFPIGNKLSEPTVNVVIEITKETNTKYEYDSESETFILDRCLISSMKYPVNYGFIPQTIGDDDDPLDIIVYSSEPMITGTVIKNCKIVGGLDMRDEGVKDYKLLAVPEWNTANINDIIDIPETFLNITRDFFKHYKNLLNKKVVTKNWFGKKRAKRIILRGNEKYVDQESIYV